MLSRGENSPTATGMYGSWVLSIGFREDGTKGFLGWCSRCVVSLGDAAGKVLLHEAVSGIPPDKLSGLSDWSQVPPSAPCTALS